MKNRCGLWIHLALALAGAGCGPPSFGESASELVSDNGVSLNGVSLNGVSPNGVSLNGVSLNGVSLNGVRLNGVGLSGVVLVGTRFYAVSSYGVVSGYDLIGARFSGLLSDGTTLRLRIDGIEPSISDRETHFYVVSYRSGDSWSPLCGTGSGGIPVQAIPLRGAWDHRQGVPGGGAKIYESGLITFACRGAALAKCVELGYKPWRYDRHHQACVRMLRADYCGDGRSWTKSGRKINLYDGIGIQEDDQGWSGEAEWSTTGALCIRKPRVILDDMPACAGTRPPPSGSCLDRTHFSTGTLLMSEYQQQLDLD
jgi:hypothetical protein